MADDKPAGKSLMDSLNDGIAEARVAAEKQAAEVQKMADDALAQASSYAVAGGREVASVFRQGLEAASGVADEGKVYVDKGVSELKAVEDLVVGHLKSGLELAQAYPYISYPAFITGTLLALPPTRRLLYRVTLGRLRSVDNIITGSEGKVEGLKVKMGDYSTEAKKLQERMVIAEEEYTRGRTKLKATRQELQRLASVVGKSEKAAAGVLEDLRTIKKVDKAVALRAEAASQVSALKAQRIALQQYIYRIAAKDI